MRRYNILFVVMFSWLCASCYDDKGNYDYKDKLNIRVEGIEKSYHVIPFKDTVAFNPKIYPEDRDYECFWGVVPYNERYAVLDTLSKERSWKFPVELPVGNYILRFFAKDTETGIFSYTEYEFLVESELNVGWWVLKDEGGDTDVDLFMSKREIPDIISKVNGRRLAGEAKNILFELKYAQVDEKDGKVSNAPAVIVGSGKDIGVLDLYTGQFVGEYDKLFYELPANRNVRTVFRGNSALHAYIDNKLYTMPVKSWGALYTKFSILVEGDYELSPYRHSSPGGIPILFNISNSSFCGLRRTSTGIEYFRDIEGKPSSNNMDMEPVFIGGRKKDQTGDRAYVILKKRGKEEYHLAKLDGYPAFRQTPIEEMNAMPAGLKLYAAKYKTLNQDNDIVYFAEGNKIYSCNLETNQESLQPVSIPSDEEITYMESIKYDPYGMSDIWFDYVAIGTVRGGRYKLYLHPLHAGMLQPAVKVLEGKGRVKRVVYIEVTGRGIYSSSLF